MAKDYKVTDVNERKRFTAGGREQTFYDVTILTDRGATGTIRIPAAEYKKEEVEKLLDQLAGKLDMPFEL